MGKTDFTFGIITDTHILPSQGDDSSPYAVNDLANERARYACALLAAHSPDFTIHLGDMVHTLPHLPTYRDACHEAHSIFESLKPNLHYVAGNHDIGDKPMVASPAGGVDQQSENGYSKHFGESWYGFQHGDCVFFVLNSSLVNTGTERETTQRRWFEQELRAHSGKRLFVCSHYPPFINQPDEPAHYDNYEEPGRKWLLDLMNEHRVEAVFSGHVHQFFYNCYGYTKLYCLPPTSFTRQDYSELYRTRPEPEFGRDDRGKFSVALIHVNSDRHRLEIIPTDGKRASEDYPAINVPKSAIPHSNLAVHLRHAWYEANDLPFNGPMEEFSRKRARNDYTLMRLWQMGILRVRTPLDDLVDPVGRRRMLDWAASGMAFTLVTASAPDDIPWQLLFESRLVVAEIEFATRREGLEQLLSGLGEYAKRVPARLNVTKIHTSADEKRVGSKFAHNVSSGFLPDEADEVLELASLEGDISSVVYQINIDDDLDRIIHHLIGVHKGSGVDPAFNIRFATRSPALANFDDDIIERRVASALVLARKFSDLEFQFDTFMDIDRGYSPRNGLIDRSSNFRSAGRILAYDRDL
ncbi:MAG: metallophosphoesterase family protein [Anderseniella sp.]